ncbi:SRPBCC family protein [Nocardioides aquiterrae]|uniref:Carbon monoxide dehydrogenase n=1 Tax=Nocardioides aquiterrae TaxID=203799 RepID=A0ABN1UE84_9ACTN
MLLKNEFEIDAGVDRAWELLTDLARIMPCMPGAALEGVEGDNYLGNVKIKVGPIGAHFRGTAHFAQKDDATHSAVIAAAGKDPKGQAAANAQIHARLEPVTPTRTRVLIDTDLDISGRMAQFGRGAIADVSNRLIGQFVANISVLLTEPAGGAANGVPSGSQAPAPAAPHETTSAPNPPAAAFPAAPAGGGEASMDLMALVVPMVKERYGQAIIGGLIGFLLSWFAFGRRVRRDGTR